MPKALRPPVNRRNRQSLRLLYYGTQCTFVRYLIRLIIPNMVLACDSCTVSLLICLMHDYFNSQKLSNAMAVYYLLLARRPHCVLLTGCNQRQPRYHLAMSIVCDSVQSCPNLKFEMNERKDFSQTLLYTRLFAHCQSERSCIIETITT